MLKIKTKILTIIAILLLLAFAPEHLAQAEKKIDKSIVSLQSTINNPIGLTVTADGTILFSSSDTHKIYAHSGDSTSIFAGFDVLDDDGEPMAGFYDSDKETALFHSPAGMDVDQAGNIYVADSGNHAIRVISKDGKVDTIAGDGISGDQDGKGATARFYQPMDVAVAKDGTVYVADTLNHVIRKVSTDDQVTTLTKNPDRLVEVNNGLVVNGGDYKNGKIENSFFNEPSSLVIDDKGNLFVSDSGNHVIRYIDFEKDEVTTIAGVADASHYNDTTLYLEGGYKDGLVQNAKFQTPKGLTLTKGGNLVVVDSGNSHIRYINLADQSVQSMTTDRDLLFPSDIGITENGDLIVSDTQSNELKKLVLWHAPDGFGDYRSAEERYDDDKVISSWAKDSVYKAQRLGIMIGDEKNKFSPKQVLTRGQFAKMIVETLNIKQVVDENVFSDVGDKEWYAPYIHTAAAYGIVNGYGNGKFGPNDPITREQIALMIGRTKNWTTDEKTNIYKDQNKISKEALPTVLALYEKKIMIGDDNNYFNPKSSVTREMGAVVMVRLVENQ